MEELTKKLTYHEFKTTNFDNDPVEYYYELINGKPVKKLTPSFEHQNVVGNLLMATKIYSRENQKGQVLMAPLDVVLDEFNVFQPDLLFVKKDRFHVFENEDEVVVGAPNLVMEVLEKETVIYDKGEKKDACEQFGVQEYWLIEPKTQVVEVYALNDRRYKLVQYLEETGEVESQVLEGFKLDRAKIFED